MAMRLAVLLLAMLMALASLAHGVPVQNRLEDVENWFEKLPRAYQAAKFHFYLHNIVGGENATTVQVAQADVTSTSSTKFGLVDIMDAPLTAKADPDSELVGYAQGLFAMSSQTEASSLISLVFVFKGGEYNGSTLSALGRNPVNEKYREFPIVGGSGKFRLAQGIGIVQNYEAESANDDEILTCDFFVVGNTFGYAVAE